MSLRCVRCGKPEDSVLKLSKLSRLGLRDVLARQPFSQLHRKVIRARARLWNVLTPTRSAWFDGLLGDGARCAGNLHLAAKYYSRALHSPNLVHQLAAAAGGLVICGESPPESFDIASTARLSGESTTAALVSALDAGKEPDDPVVAG